MPMTDAELARAIREHNEKMDRDFPGLRERAKTEPQQNKPKEGDAGGNKEAACTIH